MSDFEAHESSNIGWARYNATTRVLEVDFKDKTGSKTSTYSYADFPEEMWIEFNASDSKGRFFAYHIRPKYKGVKTWARG